MWREMNLTILGVKVILHFAGLLLPSLANIKLPATLPFSSHMSNLMA